MSICNFCVSIKDKYSALNEEKDRLLSNLVGKCLGDTKYSKKNKNIADLVIWGVFLATLIGGGVTGILNAYQPDRIKVFALVGAGSLMFLELSIAGVNELFYRYQPNP